MTDMTSVIAISGEDARGGVGFRRDRHIALIAIAATIVQIAALVGNHQPQGLCRLDGRVVGYWSDRLRDPSGVLPPTRDHRVGAGPPPSLARRSWRSPRGWLIRWTGGL